MKKVNKPICYSQVRRNLFNIRESFPYDADKLLTVVLINEKMQETPFHFYFSAQMETFCILNNLNYFVRR